MMTQDDTTLAGYFEVHDRPPAYKGSDGHPYTVSVETEKTPDLEAPYAGYLVFPRWAQSGVGIVGHVETPTVVRAASAAEATERLGALTLYDVQDLLEEAIRRDAAGEEPEDAEDGASRDGPPGTTPAKDPHRHG
ncbi:MAG: hypothetical protein R3304_11740 [Longimicrobiales bacterium]|nr:hypothetical protein [Longimicrobiales bacterium]